MILRAFIYEPGKKKPTIKRLGSKDESFIYCGKEYIVDPKCIWIVKKWGITLGKIYYQKDCLTSSFVGGKFAVIKDVENKKEYLYKRGD